MNGVAIPEILLNGHRRDKLLIPGAHRKSRSLIIRPSISRGRGYAVVLIREEIDDEETILVEPAPHTAKLAKIGRFNSFPANASVADINDVTLRKIFSCLTEPKEIFNLTAVCKRWHQTINTLYFDHPDPKKRLKIKKPCETTKIKLFGNPKLTCAVETRGQKKHDVENLFKEATIVVKDVGEENTKLLAHLSKLAMFLTPLQVVTFGDLEINDALLIYVLTIWQQRFTEVRFLRCSFRRMTTVGMDILVGLAKLKSFYIDNCSTPINSPLSDTTKLFRICKRVSRWELCFTENVHSVDDQFMELVSKTWQEKSNIRWIKLANSPSITTVGVSKFVAHFTNNVKDSRRWDYDSSKKLQMKNTNLVLWLCNTGFDVDEFMTMYPGKRWFREEKMPTTTKRMIHDNYGGEDVLIWVETKAENGDSASSSSSSN